MLNAHLRAVRKALAGMTPEMQAAWRGRCGDEGMELRARSLVERTEAKMRAAGQETTIRAVWIALADAAVGGDPETRAAAMLAGMALGLRQG